MKCTTAVLLSAAFFFTPLVACQSQISSPAVEQRVKALIGKTLNRATQQRAFADLEALRCSAVPEMIQQMDDRRNLPDGSHISLENKSPQRFEAVRFYGRG